MVCFSSILRIFSVFNKEPAHEPILGEGAADKTSVFSRIIASLAKVWSQFIEWKERKFSVFNQGDSNPCKDGPHPDKTSAIYQKTTKVVESGQRNTQNPGSEPASVPPISDLAASEKKDPVEEPTNALQISTQRKLSLPLEIFEEISKYLSYGRLALSQISKSLRSALWIKPMKAGKFDQAPKLVAAYVLGCVEAYKKAIQNADPDRISEVQKPEDSPELQRIFNDRPLLSAMVDAHHRLYLAIPKTLRLREPKFVAEHNEPLTEEQRMENEKQFSEDRELAYRALAKDDRLIAEIPREFSSSSQRFSSLLQEGANARQARIEKKNPGAPVRNW